MRLESNPLLKAAVSRSSKLTLIGPPVVAGLLCIAAWWTLTEFKGTNIDGLPWHGLAILIVVNWLTPALTFVVAVNYTRERTSDDSFTLLRSTALSPRAMLVGYSVDVLLRMRWLLLGLPLLFLMSASLFEGELVHFVDLPFLLIVWLLSHVVGALLGVWSMLRLGGKRSIVLTLAAMVGAFVYVLGVVRDSIRFDCPLYIETAPVPWLPVIASLIMLAVLTWVIPTLTERTSSLESLPLLLLLVSFFAAWGWLSELQLQREQQAAISLYGRNDQTCQMPGAVCSCGRVIAIINTSQTFGPSSITFGPEIGALAYLRAIRIDGIDQPDLPSALFEIPYLQSVEMTDVGLEALPPSLGQAGNLVSLNVARNSISEVPAEIGRLRQLQVLSLSDNQISELPLEFGQLEKLEFLTLDDNQLDELPSEMEQLSALERVTLSSNRFRTVPAVLLRMESLEAAALVNNPLTVVPPNVCVDERIFLDLSIQGQFCAE